MPQRSAKRPLAEADTNANPSKKIQLDKPNKPSTSKYDEYPVPALKDHLQKRCLKISGNKPELIERLCEADANTSLLGKPDYDKLKVPDLKADLKSRGLKMTGSRPELVQRLRQADHDSSLPVKQAMEASARKRREAAEKKREATGKGKDPHDVIGFWEKAEKRVRSGPNGSPFYDERGYEVSYEKLANRPKSFSRSDASFRREEEYFERLKVENMRKAEIMGLDINDIELSSKSTYMDWRVAQDLEIPYHKVEMCDYELWRMKGFKVKPDEMKRENMTKEHVDLVMEFMTGSGYRK